MLFRFSFGEVWHGWMRECISATSFSILVYGSPFKLFKVSRGIWQGDPFSPFLFTILVETLSMLLVRTIELRVINGFEVSQGEAITDLKFANDTILFKSFRREETLALKRILRCFQLVSGLQINMSKSVLVGIGCLEETIQSLASFICCKLGKLRFVYLVLPIGAKARSKSLWDHVIVKFERKLALWKKQYVSLGGRITRIKACLSNLLVYYMSSLKMPKVVADKMDRIRRKFLWEGQGDKKMLHLMKWSEVIKPKRSGGLGLRNFENKNEALLAKWW